MNKSVNFKKFFTSVILLFSAYFCFSQTNEAPSISAQGRQFYCPNSTINIVTDFSITDPDDIYISAFYIQISEGYQKNADELRLTGTHPNINTSWDVDEGKLSLTPRVGGLMLITELEEAVKDVVFSSRLGNPTPEKFFSLSIGDANYLPSTDHFYEFVAAERIRWSQAKVDAENRTYFGRTGYLATLTSQEESDFAGKQASGAGWIGASDEETEGIWKWVTGPEAGTIFWRGRESGTTPNFAFWNRNEPNDQGGNEDYAHITDNNVPNAIIGSWNDLPDFGGSGLYIPKGYIVEYGKPGDPPLAIVATTSIFTPQIISTSDSEICVLGSTTIEAKASHGEVEWYENQFGGNSIYTGERFNTPFLTNSTTYYVSILFNGCRNFVRKPVQVTVKDNPTITSTTDATICSGSAILSAESSEGDVYWYETSTSNIPIFIGDNFTTPVLINTKSYFVEANYNGCTSLNRKEVTAFLDTEIPTFYLEKENYILCKDIGNIDLKTTNPAGIYRYVWKKNGGLLDANSSTINISESGAYTVSAVSIAGCTSPEQTIIVKDSEKSNLTKEDVIITDDSINNSIQIANLNIGGGDYEFSLDYINGVYSDNHFFDNLSPGIHTLYIRDKGGCGIQEYQFSILAYPKFFTPNGDGENDLWQINGFDRSFYTKSNIYIYNRFGNLLYTIEQNNQGWDGNFGGKKMPSNTYWFRVVLTDINGYSLEKFGNISLIR